MRIDAATFRELERAATSPWPRKPQGTSPPIAEGGPLVEGTPVPTPPQGGIRRLGPGVVKVGVTFLICTAVVAVSLTWAFAFNPTGMKEAATLIQSFIDMVSEMTNLFMVGVFGLAGGAGGATAWKSRKPS